MPTINILISGVSVSGDIDTGAMPVRIEHSNSDQIGHVAFALTNNSKTYSNLLSSGAPTFELDINGVAYMRGRVERTENTIAIGQGTTTIVHAYDYGAELLNVVSPDARQPPPTFVGVLTSGEQGVNAQDGLDLVLDVSGINYQSGATLASFMAQYFGREADPSGSFSGTRLSFKPHISGYTWDTWYRPEATDRNVNYWIPVDTFKVRREYAWDTLRRITRGNVVLDSNGNRTPFECYIGISGDIRIFTSGSAEFLASGTNGQISLIYYAVGASGSDNNNVVGGMVPMDVTTLKNRILGWFPRWSRFPNDGDSFTDLAAYSGSRWSGTAPIGQTTLSGDAPAFSGVGVISIMGTQVSGGNDASQGGFDLVYRHPVSFDLSRFAIQGSPVSITYRIKMASPQNAGNMTYGIKLVDTSGNNMWISGTDAKLERVDKSGLWGYVSEQIYDNNGVLLSGNGNSAGWRMLAGNSGIAMNRIIQINLGCFIANAGFTVHTRQLWVDNLAFTFNYNYSPIVAFNSGSQGLFRRRYEVFEYPYSVADVQASAIITQELNSRMGSKGVAEFQVKDNPNLRYSAQLDTRPGQVITIDAPTLNTGSGQTFNYWKIIALDHDYSAQNGFLTRMRAVPWFSGTLVDPNSNLVDFTLPMRYNREISQSASLPWALAFTKKGGMLTVVPMSPTDNVV